MIPIAARHELKVTHTLLMSSVQRDAFNSVINETISAVVHVVSIVSPRSCHRNCLFTCERLV